MFKKLNLNQTYQYLMIALAFLMPLTVSGANIIIVIISFIWLFSGDYKPKLKQIYTSKLMVASIVFYFMHIIGMIWTEDISWGFHTLHKMWYFLLLLPILFTIVIRENIDKYIFSFLLAIAITEVFSYLIWFEIIAPFRHASVENPTPFMSHISYNPILAFAIYLVLHKIIFNKKMTDLVFFLYSFFALSMSINMFITGGRSGQVVFFAMLVILVFQIFDKQRIKALISIMMVIPIIFFSAYQTSDLFNKRVNQGITEVISYSDPIYRDNSIGLRISFTSNSFKAIKKSPIIGFGTGDFPVEYNKIHQINSPGLPTTSNPHNMYILVLMQLGIVGLFSMLSIFYYQIKLSQNSSIKMIRDSGVALPLMFLVMMLGDSYLLGHYTTLMFVFFSSFLYKDFEKN